LTMMRTLLARKAEAEAILEQQQIERTAEEVDESAIDENSGQSGAGGLSKLCAVQEIAVPKIHDGPKGQSGRFGVR